MTDGIKHISQLIENIMFLTIVNSTTDDEGYYQCILETPIFQRREVSMYLSVNDSVTHMGLIDGMSYSTDDIGVSGYNLTWITDSKCTCRRSKCY